MPLPSSVHPQETESVNVPTSEKTFRHGGWWSLRRRFRTAIEENGAGRHRLERWDACGNRAVVCQALDDPTHLHIRAEYCHDRFCRPCSNARGRLISGNLRPHVDPKKVRFLTLTQRSTTESLSELIDTLFQRFRRLRNLKEWKHHVRGGAGFIEITWNSDLERWHVHVHLLIEGVYFAQALVKKLWLNVTGDSTIVDIRSIGSPQELINYVTKYVTKSIDNSVWQDPARLREAVGALAGRKQMITFGSWRGLLLYKKPEPEACRAIDHLNVVLRNAKNGQPTALAILKVVSNKKLNDHENALLRALVPPEKPPDEHKTAQGHQLYLTGLQTQEQWYSR